MKKFYLILGISENASLDEAKTAYKREVKKYHPDLYNGNKSFAEQKTAEINVAFEMVSQDIQAKAAKVKAAAIRKPTPKQEEKFGAESRREEPRKATDSVKKEKRKSRIFSKTEKKTSIKQQETSHDQEKTKQKTDIFHDFFGNPHPDANKEKFSDTSSTNSSQAEDALSGIDGEDADYNSTYITQPPEEEKKRKESIYARVSAEEFREDKQQKTVDIYDTYDNNGNKFTSESEGKKQSGRILYNLLLSSIFVGILVIIIILLV